MTTAFQRFAAVRPASTDEQDLYALTSGEIAGAVYITNQDSSTRTYRIAVTDAASGTAADNADWIRYDESIEANVTHRVEIYGMAATSTVRIKASVADKLSFVFMGMLIT